VTGVVRGTLLGTFAAQPAPVGQGRKSGVSTEDAKADLLQSVDLR
jgi:hypothetical protein